MQRTARTRKNSQRTHSLGGCDNCRRRHMKCDRSKPACLNCQTVAAVCSGYSSELIWMNTPDTSVANDTIRDVRQGRPKRNYLFTEESRVSMTTTLRSDLASRSVDKSILELDSRSRSKQSTNDEGIAVGPFSVFSLPAESNTSHTNMIRPSNEPAPVPEPVPIETAEVAAPSIESFGSLNDLHDWLEWQDLFDLDHQYSDLQAGAFPIDDSYNLGLEAPDATFCSNTNLDEVQDPASSRDHSEATSWPQGLKVTSAETLLNHFSEDVVPQLVSIPLGGKSVWDATIVPSAILTLAKLTYMTSGQASKAEVANLLGLCATSAIHLSNQRSRQGDSNAQYWQDFAAQALSEAKQRLQWSLLNENKGSKKAKYKDQLMATFAIVNHSILYDNQPEARAGMLESERLLRHRGLAKRYISRKARLLHHLYSWIRIVLESTYVLHDYKSGHSHETTRVRANARKRRREEESGANARSQNRSDGPDTRLDDFLRLEPNAAEAEQVTTSRDEVGIRDIHYESSSDRKGTLYMQLYGISENWLSLVSQTARLSNVLDGFKTNPQRNIETLDSLERRKMRLEHLVCSFAMNDSNAHQTPSEAIIDENLVNETASLYAELRSYMTRAFNSSLVIFFYRRVRDVSPWILQEHVDKVIRALKDFRASCERHNMNGPSSPWPGFIAGCEAMSNTQREYFKTWFDTAVDLTGFTRFQAAKECMIEVWARRDFPQREQGSGRDQVYSWITLAREKKLHVMLA